jgi:ribosome assembly protein 1
VCGSVSTGVVAGFQLATAAGPLCEEPLWGVLFELEVQVAQGQPRVNGADGSVKPGVDPELQEDVYGPFSGQVMTAVAAACRRAVLEADPRLVEALYLCQVQAAAEALSGCYAALGRRRARILAEEMREGSGAFSVHAYLPVEASFGLADELRRKTSGAASASLMLSHWERLQVGGKGREGEGKGNGKGREGKGAGGPAGCCVCCIMLVWAGSREVGRMC